MQRFAISTSLDEVYDHVFKHLYLEKYKIGDEDEFRDLDNLFTPDKQHDLVVRFFKANPDLMLSASQYFNFELIMSLDLGPMENYPIEG